uniref:Putative niFe hydrogenase-like protein n=1 Tax=Helianthus annuus TaxID=4232 RepID=A0A251T9I5_HELAN
MIVNMGPHHPSMHGVLRLIVTLDGEDVIDCEPILGYLHREAITVNAPEQLGNIQVPKRASYIRVIMLELSRIASHLLWLGPFMAVLGADSFLLYFSRKRINI